MRKNDGQGPWVPALLGPYLERQAADLFSAEPRCVVQPDDEGTGDGGGLDARRQGTAAAVNRMLGRPTEVLHRADGKPEVSQQGISVSASHNAGVTLAVASEQQVGCDAELVRDRTADDWQALLGAEQFALAELIQREVGEELSVAGTRVWGAVESLRKVGRPIPGSVTLAHSRPDGWVLLRSGHVQIATFPTRLRDEPDPVVFAILSEGEK